MRTLLLLGWVIIAGVKDELGVDSGTVLNDVRRRCTGVNVDYLMDDDRNPLLSARHKLSEALRELSPRYLRYPGGWKSAINLWSVQPYTFQPPHVGWSGAGRLDPHRNLSDLA